MKTVAALLVPTQLPVAVSAFCSSLSQLQSGPKNNQRTRATHIFATDDNSDNTVSSSSYESSASVTKGLVSSLTSLTNNIFRGNTKETADVVALATRSTKNTPTSPEELLQRIQQEYTLNNYLWTGNIDTSSFVSNCTFTDPTLSFVGVDNYVKNVGNLVPIVEYALGEKQISNSTLLEITLEKDKGYIQTRWNMIGELNALFWKPKIDVVGRTKFWYQEQQQEGEQKVQVYYYDEEWELPAGMALLQLITPAGTIRRSDQE